MPTTLNNYTFSDVTYSIEENADIATALGVSYATITISPVTGFTVTATDFSIDPSFSSSYVDSVVFSQSGDNVICTINFATGITMPPNNLTIPLCIVGEGVIKKITLRGKLIATVGSNVTGDSTENTNYLATGHYGVSELLFSRTYNAASGYYWNSMPVINITAGNVSDYNIITTPTFDVNNRLTNISYDINYIYPNVNASANIINISVPSTQEIYNPLPNITGYLFDRSSLGISGGVRRLTVFGVPGTEFSATLNDGSTTTTIISSEVLDSNGKYEYDITFPALGIGDPNVTYTIELTGDYVSTIEQPNPFTIQQLQNVTIEIGIANEPTPISGWPIVNPKVINKALSTSPYENIFDSENIWLLEINENITPTSGTGTFTINKQVDANDFDNTEVIYGSIDGDQTATTTLVLTDTTGILPGDRFNNVYIETDKLSLAPFKYEVVSVDSGTQLTITPAITTKDGGNIGFSRSNGNIIEILNSEVSLVDPSTVNIKFNVAVLNCGDTDILFNLDLSNIISYIP